MQSTYTRANKNTGQHKTHTRGWLVEGPAPSSVVPVAGDLGHTAVSLVRHKDGKRKAGRWEHEENERGWTYRSLEHLKITKREILYN